MRRLFVLALALAPVALASVALAPAAHAQPRRGDAAPDPGAEAFLNAPDGAAWIDTYGQAVVLDFWATWCGPCIATIPHLNSLADQYADRPVRFVSLTAEDAETVRPFLEKRPIRGWVALDTDSTGGRAYGVSAIPQTALIGRDGRLAAIVHPTQVTAGMLDSLLAGIPLDHLPDEAAQFQSIDSLKSRVERYRATPAPTENVSEVRWLAPGEHPPNYERYAPDIDASRRDAMWYGPLEIILRASPPDPSAEGGFATSRVVGPDSLIGRYMKVRIVAPNVPEAEFREHVLEEVGRALGLTIRDAVEPVPSFVLRQSEGGVSLKPSTGSPRSSRAPGSIIALGADMSRIAMAIEGCLDTPVVDRTGATGIYDMQLLLDPEVVHCRRPDEAQTEAVREALRETAGLDLVPETLTLPVTVVEPRP